MNVCATEKQDLWTLELFWLFGGSLSNRCCQWKPGQCRVSPPPPHPHEGCKWPWAGEGSGGSTSLWISRTVPFKAVTVQASESEHRELGARLERSWAGSGKHFELIN
jgi:hypothetical protein